MPVSSLADSVVEQPKIQIDQTKSVNPVANVADKPQGDIYEA